MQNLFSELKSFSVNKLHPTKTVVRTLGVPDETTTAEARVVENVKYLSATRAEMHGSAHKSHWGPPRMIVECDVEARPGYSSCKAHEFHDQPDVLEEKIQTLADLIKKSQRMLVYTGAGISTASGIHDYATRFTDAHNGEQPQQRLLSPMDAQPTIAHRCVTALYSAGFVKHWVQQNHDGLPQKAGFPQSCLNEIHGAWYDPSNPVVKMSGNLRSDLFEWLLEWEVQTDLCLTMGTSLSGMNADRVVTTVGKKSKQHDPTVLGAVIINLQQTQHDNACTLRIFAKIDEVMMRLLDKLSLTLPADIPNYRDDQFTFTLPYNEEGFLDRSRSMVLCLEPDSTVMVTDGPYKGCVGIVQSPNREGHIKIQISVELKASVRAPFVVTLGKWWLREAELGTIPRLPVIPCPPKPDTTN